MKTKTRFRGKWLWLGLLAALAVFVYANVYADRILPGVTIGSIGIGGMTRAEAAAKLMDSLSQHRILLTYKERSWQPLYTDLGIAFDVSGAVDEAFAVGRSSGISRVLRAVVLRTPVQLRYEWSDETLNNYLHALAEDIGDPPQNASVHVVDGQFLIVPEQQGHVIDRGEFHALLAQPLGLAAAISIELQPRLSAAEVAREDLLEPVRNAEILVSRGLQLKSRDKTFTVERAQLVQWVAFEASGREVSSLGPIPRPAKAELSINDDAVTTTLRELALEIENEPEEQRVLISKNKIEVLRAGRAGRRVALAQATELTKHHLLSGFGEPIELPMVEVPATIAYEDPPAAPIKEGKVISVDLTKMLEYLYENAELVYTSKISPGINNWTPTGTFKIYAKTKRQKMSGPGYYLPNVPNILWFKGDYSVHGVYWHNDFGIRPRSHGCVGQPLDEAEWVFNWAEVGTPVVIYKS